MDPTVLFVGIDVAQAECVGAVRPTGTTWTVPQTEAGWTTLATRLQALAPTLVLCEATGGLELPLASVLAAADLPLAIVNLRQVRDFAKAKGLLAKTDALDAAALAHFADALRKLAVTRRSQPGRHAGRACWSK
jgi:transposase